MICSYRAIPSSKSKWNTRTVSSVGRSRNKQGKCLRSHFEESEEKQNVSKACAIRHKHGRARGRAQQAGCANETFPRLERRKAGTDAENCEPPVTSCASSELLLRSWSLAKEHLLPETDDLLQPDQLL